MCSSVARQAYWEILGLDTPPKDRRTVKLAYSKQLKLTRPEEDPDGFMRLRDAHDMALRLIAREAAMTLPEPEQNPEPSLTYEDMIDPPEPPTETAYSTGRSASLDAPPQTKTTPEVQSSTAYAIGESPHLDAPVQDTRPKRAPEPPNLHDDIMAILGEPKKRNDRESWNLLFRKARQMDIDDYVDFEALLLHLILKLHGYYDPHNSNFDQPEKLPKHFSPSTTASLFKTMNWDQVGRFNSQQSHEIEWLGRRMGVNKPAYYNQAPNTYVKTKDRSWVWIVLVIAVIGFNILRALAA